MTSYKLLVRREQNRDCSKIGKEGVSRQAGRLPSGEPVPLLICRGCLCAGRSLAVQIPDLEQSPCRVIVPNLVKV